MSTGSTGHDGGHDGGHAPRLFGEGALDRGYTAYAYYSGNGTCVDADECPCRAVPPCPEPPPPLNETALALEEAGDGSWDEFANFTAVCAEALGDAFRGCADSCATVCPAPVYAGPAPACRLDPCPCEAMVTCPLTDFEEGVAVGLLCAISICIIGCFVRCGIKYKEKGVRVDPTTGSKFKPVMATVGLER